MGLAAVSAHRAIRPLHPVLLCSLLSVFRLSCVQTVMKNDIDDLLKQYLPMGEDGKQVDRRAVDTRSLIAANTQDDV